MKSEETDPTCGRWRAGLWLDAGPSLEAIILLYKTDNHSYVLYKTKIIFNEINGLR